MSFTVVNIGLMGVLGLLGVALYSFLITRNLIKLVITLQIMVKAALLGLVVAGNASGQIQVSQSLAVTVIVADTIVAVVGLAMAVQIRRRLGTLDIRELSSLRG